MSDSIWIPIINVILKTYPEVSIKNRMLDIALRCDTDVDSVILWRTGINPPPHAQIPLRNMMREARLISQARKSHLFSKLEDILKDQPKNVIQQVEDFATFVTLPHPLLKN